MKFLHTHLDDLLIVAGGALIIYATAILSITAALFVAGVFLIVLGVLVGLGGKA